MIELKHGQPTETGFYFLNYYFSQQNEIYLDKLTINKKGELISKKDDEDLNLYDDSAFSIKLPDYITNKFMKTVNHIIKSNISSVDIDFAINETEIFDDSFTVFIKTGSALYILTQNIMGAVDKTILYGDHSLFKLKKII